LADVLFGFLHHYYLPFLGMNFSRFGGAFISANLQARQDRKIRCDASSVLGTLARTSRRQPVSQTRTRTNAHCDLLSRQSGQRERRCKHTTLLSGSNFRERSGPAKSEQRTYYQ
jgi:hypothetical protein